MNPDIPTGPLTPAGRADRTLRQAGWWLSSAVLAGLFLLPLLPTVTNSTLFTLTLMLTTVGVAVNWNLTGGFTGYVDFGHAVWFGIGAYTTAILMSLQSNGLQIGWSPAPAIGLGALVAGLLAAAIGRVTMRLKGPYFSIAMLGTFVAMREIVRVSGGVTGGGVGLTLPPYLNRPLFYYIHLVLVVLLVTFTWWLRRTRFGAALVAIREDEIGAEMRGIDTTQFKVSIFSFSGLSTGLFGGLWAYQNTFVDPDIAFVEVRTIDAVMSTMLGGLGTVAGPVVGAVLLYWLREVLWANLLDLHLLTQGALLIVIVLFIPRGLVGIADRQGTSVTDLGRTWLGRTRGSPDEDGEP
jgi:branched-chain amino acid transport system permease protein